MTGLQRISAEKWKCKKDPNRNKKKRIAEKPNQFNNIMEKAFAQQILRQINRNNETSIRAK